MKKALSLVLVFCLLLCVAACGKEQAPPESTDSAAQSATESADSATPSKTEDDAQESTTTTQKANDTPTTTGNNKTTSNKVTTTTKAASTSKSIPSTTQKATTATPLAKAQAAIKAKDYETAYSILYAIKNRNQAEEALFKCFAFQPIEKVDSDGDKTTYTYDANGYLIKEKDGYAETIYTYNNGNLIKKKTNDASTTYTYNKNGDVLTENYTSNDNSMWEKIVNTYDASGKRTERIVTCNFYIQYKMTYHYNKNGRITSATCLYLDEDATSPVTYTYDKNGNILSIHTFMTIDSETYDYKENFTYNTNGKILTYSVVSSMGSETEKRTVTFTYDENGHIKTEKANDSDGSRSSATYVCDMYGNVLSENYTHFVPDSGNNIFSASTSYKLHYYPNGMPKIPEKTIYDDIGYYRY